MPIFEYHCFDCGSRFEDLVIGQKKDTVACSHCGGSSVERVFSTFAARSESSNGGECYNKSAGVCQAGGGSMPCGMMN